MNSSDDATDDCFAYSVCLPTEITLEVTPCRYNQLNDKVLSKNGLF